jgi:hypothetical protein
MIAAAPLWDAPLADQEQTIKKTCPPCLGEALKREFIMYQ